MQIKKESKFSKFETLALSKEATLQLKGGGEYNGNVAIIVDWS